MNTIKKIGREYLVSKLNAEATIKTAKEINNAVLTKEGPTEITKVSDKVIREILETLSSKIVDKSTRLINIEKLEKILKVEENFYTEIANSPEFQVIKNMPKRLRFTATKIVGTLNYGRVTKEEIRAILHALDVPAKDPGFDDADLEIEVLKTLGMYNIETMHKLKKLEEERNEGKNKGGHPTVYIDTACKVLSKNATKKKINLEVISNPKVSDYDSRGLSRPYGENNKTTNVLFVLTDSKGKKKSVSMEYFGWTGLSFEKDIVSKHKQIADEFGHLYGVVSPNTADNQKAMKKVLGDLFDRETKDIEMMTCERAAHRWVMTNDKYTGISRADAIYNGFYACLEELGIAHKIMPKSKVELFKRS